MKYYQATVKVQAEIQYASLRKEVAQQDIPKEIPPLIGILMNLLNKENIKTNGDCFFRYLSCTNNGQMVIEAGFPIEKPNSKPENIEFGTFPSGKYLT